MNATKNPTPTLACSIKEAAEIIGLSRAVIYEAVRVGTLPSVRIGRRILISRAVLAQLFGVKPPAGSSPAPDERTTDAS